MEKLNFRGQKNSSDIVNNLIEENEGLKAVVSDYSQLKSFAEEVVEKHNTLLTEYKSRQTELTEAKDYIEILNNELDHKAQEIKRQKDIITNLDNKLHDFQNHINNLIERFKDIEKDNSRLKGTIESLEKYIEVMDNTQRTVKNERGAGRKKKYDKDQIDLAVGLRLKGWDYDKITQNMNESFSHKKWDIKEIKYIYSRYKQGY